MPLQPGEAMHNGVVVDADGRTAVGILPAGNGVIGGVTGVAITHDETASVGAALAAAATGFGGIRDLLGAAVAAQSAGNARYVGGMRALVSADQSFTLGVEYDIAVGFGTPDQAGQVASAAGRGGRHFALLAVVAGARYGRLFVTNLGAVAMTNLRARATLVG